METIKTILVFLIIIIVIISSQLIKKYLQDRIN